MWRIADLLIRFIGGWWNFQARCVKSGKKRPTENRIWPTDSQWLNKLRPVPMCKHAQNSCTYCVYWERVLSMLCYRVHQWTINGMMIADLSVNTRCTVTYRCTFLWLSNACCKKNLSWLSIARYILIIQVGLQKYVYFYIIYKEIAS